MREGKLERKVSGRPSSSSWKLSIIFYRQRGTIELNNRIPSATDIMTVINILPQPLRDPSDCQVWGISPAWMESSSSCNFSQRAGRPQCQEHNRRSLHHPPTQTRSLSSMTGDLLLTCVDKQQRFSQWCCFALPGKLVVFMFYLSPMRSGSSSETGSSSIPSEYISLQIL